MVSAFREISKYNKVHAQRNFNNIYVCFCMHGKPLVFVGELELLMLVLIHKSDLGYPRKDFFQSS